MELDTKLALFDTFSDEAVDDIIDWMTNHREDLKAIARGRHAEGHYRFQNKGLYEYDILFLRAEAAQELADAVVYLTREKFLLKQQQVQSREFRGYCSECWCKSYKPQCEGCECQ